MKNIFFILLGSFMLLGCEKKVLLDNTSKDPLVFLVDDNETQVPGGAGIFAYIKPGKHTIKVKDMAGTVIIDTTLEIKKDGLINPFKEEYILQRQAYALEADNDDAYSDELKENFLMIDSMAYFGALQIYPAGFFFEKDWDYSPQEELPNEIVLGKNEDFKIKTKLHRKSEFISNHPEMLLSHMLDSLDIDADSLFTDEDGDETESESDE